MQRCATLSTHACNDLPERVPCTMHAPIPRDKKYAYTRRLDCYSKKHRFHLDFLMQRYVAMEPAGETAQTTGLSSALTAVEGRGPRRLRMGHGGTIG